jgi:DNA-cytosine methyltransferase
MVNQYSAIEFFSGMGSFAEACRDLPINVLACFDQSELSNKVYKHNFGLSPDHANLDSIGIGRIPEADIWWMSPPCTPYSVRGHRADALDPRARSFLHLISIIPQRQPHFIFVENVQGFKNTEVKRVLLNTLTSTSYNVQELDLCSTNFGTPMRRPRHFVIASRRAASHQIRAIDRLFAEDLIDGRPSQMAALEERPLSALSDFIRSDYIKEALVAERDAVYLRRSTSVISPNDENAIAICFTKNYYRCRSSSGSLIELPDGRLRRFTSKEILYLFGFSCHYKFPGDVNEQEATRLLGNAVDIRMVSYLLEQSLLLGSDRASGFAPEQKSPIEVFDQGTSRRRSRPCHRNYKISDFDRNRLNGEALLPSQE